MTKLQASMKDLSAKKWRENKLYYRCGSCFKACEWCGGLHQRACNRVKRQVWHPNSALIEIEFWNEWKQPGVIWPEDAYDPDSDSEGAAGGR